MEVCILTFNTMFLAKIYCMGIKYLLKTINFNNYFRQFCQNNFDNIIITNYIQLVIIKK